MKRNYDRGLVLGSLAGAGTLGFLIPPSMMMLVYGILADVSIGKLFIAGIIPGLILAAAVLASSIYAEVKNKKQMLASEDD